MKMEVNQYLQPFAKENVQLLSRLMAIDAIGIKHVIAVKRCRFQFA